MGEQTETVKTRILIISDTHCALPFRRPNHGGSSHARGPGQGQGQLPFTWPLPTADVLLHAGDLTSNGKDAQHERALALLTRINAPVKIVIPGNHDLTLDRAYYTANPRLHASYATYSAAKLDEIEALYTGERARAAGIHYLVEGTRSFVLPNGARFTLYASAYQPEFYNWAFGHPRHVDRYNPDSAHAVNPVQSQSSSSSSSATDSVDIMLTHGPPMGILDRTFRGEDVGCEHLRRAVERVRPRLHCFGHIHEAWGAVTKDWERSSSSSRRRRSSDSGDDDDDSMHFHQPEYEQDCVSQMGAYIDGTPLRAGRETLFVNASIMDRSYRPKQAPWIVDLMLPKGEKK